MLYLFDMVIFHSNCQFTRGKIQVDSHIPILFPFPVKSEAKNFRGIPIAMPRIGGGGGGFKLLHQAEAMCFLRHVFLQSWIGAQRDGRSRCCCISVSCTSVSYIIPNTYVHISMCIYKHIYMYMIYIYIYIYIICI